MYNRFADIVVESLEGSRPMAAGLRTNPECAARPWAVRENPLRVDHFDLSCPPNGLARRIAILFVSPIRRRRDDKMKQPMICREITIFPAEGPDELVDCVPITEPQFLAIAHLLGLDTRLPLVYVYPIPPELVPRVNPLLGKDLPTGAFVFFLETSAE